MAPRSKILGLPEEVKTWLDQALLSNSFSGYRQLAEELQARGFEISHAAVHRYGQEFESQLGAIRLATEQARAVAEASSDDEGALNDALIRTIQTKAFQVLVRLNSEDVDESLSNLGNMIARLGKTAIDQKKWAAAARERIERKLAALEQEASTNKSGLDLATLARVRTEIYGLT